MNKYVKGISAVVLALFLIALIGINTSDHFLKATDGQENIVDEIESDDDDTEVEVDADAATEATTSVVVEGEEASVQTGTVTVTTDTDISKPVAKGTVITLSANVEGYEDISYHFQWVRSTDGENWDLIDGANEMDYSFVMDETTCGYQWRVNLIKD